MKILITGGTGFVGPRLMEELVRNGHTLLAVARNPDSAKKILPEKIHVRQWNGVETFPEEILEGVDAIVHLMGEPVAQRWTARIKKRIRDSRVTSSRLLVESIARLAPSQRPKVLISASGIGYYGDRSDEWLVENSPPGGGFLADVCKEWEAEILAAPKEVRTVRLRIGMVLGPHGGAFAKLAPVFKMGVGGILGTGKQWVSWIHISDLVRVIQFSLENSQVTGAINAVAPSPINNKDFTLELSRAFHRPAIIRTPAIGLRLVFGEMADILLQGQRAKPEHLIQAGFVFQFKNFAEAIHDVLQSDQ